VAACDFWIEGVEGWGFCGAEASGIVVWTQVAVANGSELKHPHQKKKDAET